MNVIKYILLFASLVICVAISGFADEEKAAEKCADCHSDSIEFKEWKESGHAKSLENLLADKNVRWTCLRCHSSDYRSSRFTPWVTARDFIKPEEAKNAISCSSCHRHGTEFRHYLIMPVDKLCVSCHVLFCGG
jgi:predicted CXXCH cytochrome family protein